MSVGRKTVKKRRKSRPRYAFRGEFRDQPDGACAECLHSKYAPDGLLMCGIKTIEMTNPICLQKRQVWFLSGIDYELERQREDLDDGNDWKESK